MAVTRLSWSVDRGTLNDCTSDYVSDDSLPIEEVHAVLAAHGWSPMIAERLRAVPAIPRIVEQKRALQAIAIALNAAWRGVRNRVNAQLPEADRVALWVRALSASLAPPTGRAAIPTQVGLNYAALWRATLRLEAGKHMVRDVVDGALPIATLAHIPRLPSTSRDDAFSVEGAVVEVLRQSGGQERRVREAVERYVEAPAPTQEPHATLTRNARDATLTVVRGLGSTPWMTEMKRACSVAMESLVLTSEAIDMVPWINDTGLPVPALSEVERLTARCPILADHEVAQTALEDLKETVPAVLIEALMGAGVAWPIVRGVWERISQPRLRAAIAHALLTRDTVAAATVRDADFMAQAVDAYAALTSREDRAWVDEEYAARDLVGIAEQTMGGMDPKRWCAFVAMIPFGDSLPPDDLLRLLSKVPLWTDWPLRPSHLIPLLAHRSAPVRLYVQTWLATLPAEHDTVPVEVAASVPAATRTSPAAHPVVRRR